MSERELQFGHASEGTFRAFGFGSHFGGHKSGEEPIPINADVAEYLYDPDHNTLTVSLYARDGSGSYQTNTVIHGLSPEKAIVYSNLMDAALNGIIKIDYPGARSLNDLDKKGQTTQKVLETLVTDAQYATDKILSGGNIRDEILPLIEEHGVTITPVTLKFVGENPDADHLLDSVQLASPSSPKNVVYLNTGSNQVFHPTDGFDGNWKDGPEALQDALKLLGIARAIRRTVAWDSAEQMLKQLNGPIRGTVGPARQAKDLMQKRALLMDVAATPSLASVATDPQRPTAAQQTPDLSRAGRWPVYIPPAPQR